MVGVFGAELVASGGEFFKGFGVGGIFPNDEVGHHSAGFFGVEGDDFVGAVFLVFKDGGDEGAVEVFGLDGGEVFF